MVAAPRAPVHSLPSAATPRTPLRRQLVEAIRVMRPTQWSKNGLVVVAAVFAHRATDPATVARVACAVLAFSLTASAVYILNDIIDRHKDRLHPTKRERPVAAGRLSVTLAIVAALLSLVGAAALVAAVIVQQEASLGAGGIDLFASWGGSAFLFTATLLAYIGLNVAYSTWIKHQVLWDVFIIAAGFVLRALAGAFVAMVAISPWFYLCTLFLSLCLALGKRRAELVNVAVVGTRPTLREYSTQLLDQLLAVVVACALITYSLYTFQTPGSGHQLMITIPVVLFGVFRYLYLIYVTGAGESPDALLLGDKQILAAVFLCGFLVIAVLYGLPYLHSLLPLLVP
jgi:4-hydroxybenzoate polyprenyltransferase